ncbi:hypothetical protein QE429_000613 [Bacillus sp. SORGH_AS 510]|uniref:hypothetical protein n=1 Tax=Bacillus sp. SORGH_AS_0510 TaxID=3041771 RepID=UPI0027806917|nr:hypothetical protein [Bacillus sp. SORGH_AS_0510]MDQ1143786.1 hypothetical protein [Bacillus sp. SORGH_AS_0510]
MSKAGPSDKYITSKADLEKLKILKHQSDNLKEMGNQLDHIKKTMDSSIQESEDLLRSLGISLENMNMNQKTSERKPRKLALRSWDDLLADAETSSNDSVSFADILTAEEIQGVENRIELLRGDFKSIHRLDKIDWSICGVAGVLASIIDIFLVQMPKHPGMLGSKGHDGGPLSNLIKEKIQGALTPAEIHELERRNWVPYDPSTSRGLNQTVEGLGARTHRFQSLGHDPLLGFIFGTLDILKGRFTAIDKHGKLIIQNVDIAGRDIAGMNIFEALARVFGHMKSDISTSAGLPAPLMPLLQFLQVGSIGRGNYTIGEVSRMMYRQGYDFSHFLAMSIPTLLIEVIVRVSYFAKRMIEGNDIKDSLPFDTPGNKKPKLQTMLFSAHMIATAANAGKVAITKNPLSISYPQWIAFFKYGFQQLKWGMYEKENQMFDFVQKDINNDWDNIDKLLDETWSMFNGEDIKFT